MHKDLSSSYCIWSLNYLEKELPLNPWPEVGAESQLLPKETPAGTLLLGARVVGSGQDRGRGAAGSGLQFQGWAWAEKANDKHNGFSNGTSLGAKQVSLRSRSLSHTQAHPHSFSLKHRKPSVQPSPLDGGSKATHLSVPIRVDNCNSGRSNSNKIPGSRCG